VIAKYENFFSAAVARNPVIDLTSCRWTSDIPDWSYEEFGITFPPSNPCGSEMVAALSRASPMSHATTIKTPILFLIGEDDRRVPSSQAKGLYHYLKPRMGSNVDMLVFKKNGHALDKVEAARLSWIGGLDWIISRTVDRR
jgi:dipeptidyl aminopeptidase/acylaminoacyl peptidase